jgi:sulfate transport system permease protein
VSTSARTWRRLEGGELVRRGRDAAMIGGVWVYFAALILTPLGFLLREAFREGVRAFWTALLTPEAVHAFYVTLIVVGITCVVNTVSGVVVAFVLVRHRFFGRTFLDSLVELPFSVSPVVAGYMVLIMYAPNFGWLGPLFDKWHIKIVFALPAMVIATMFVTVPFVIRQVGPVLAEIGLEEEEAAKTLGASSWTTFRRVTLPAIKWGLLYGFTLTLARGLGEFGMVLVVSGNIIRMTQTATLHVHQTFTDYEYTAAYATSVVLAAVCFAILIVSDLIKRRGGLRHAHQHR